MPSIVEPLRAALAAFMLRRVAPISFEAGAWPVALPILALIGLTALDDWLGANSPASFQLYGVNALISIGAISVAILALFVAGRAGWTRFVVILWVFCFLQVVLSVLTQGVERVLPPERGGGRDDVNALAFVAVIVLWLAWCFAAVLRVFQGLGAAVPRPRLRAAGLILVSLFGGVLLPLWPLFAGSDFEKAYANVWEIAGEHFASPKEPDREQAETNARWAEVELAQPGLLATALDRLAPPEGDRPNLYALAIAGWSAQEVFRTETERSLAVIDETLGTKERSLALINNVATVWDHPVASLPNLAGALEGIARQMDKDRDVLVLAMTSHGERDGFRLVFEPLFSRTLKPEALKAALDDAGIKNRILVISACYSGVFLAPLADENSVVITASAPDRASFGCTNEREWTYFGDAFFNQALRQTRNLPAAFAKARALVTEWETRDKEQHSQPQIHVGAAIRKLLPDLLNEPEPARPD